MGPNEERGIYKSIDGGITWNKILYVNEDSGFADMNMDATDPNFLMATSWDFRRRPWVVKSGGPGSREFCLQNEWRAWTGLQRNRGRRH